MGGSNYSWNCLCGCLHKENRLNAWRKDCVCSFNTHILISRTTVVLSMKNCIRNLLQTLSTTVNFGSCQSNINPIWRENKIELLSRSQISSYCGLLNYDENGDSKFFRNIDAHYVMSQPRDHNIYLHCRDNMKPRNGSSYKTWKPKLPPRNVNVILKYFPV
jgi:hypothetical protein